MPPETSIDDTATITDERQQFLRQKKNTFEMDRVEAVKFFLGRLFECVVMRSAGVVCRRARRQVDDVW